MGTTVAYTSPAARTTPAATVTRIDNRLGTREAMRYTASPSMTSMGNGALPVAISSPVTVVTNATSGSGQRRIARSRPQAATARTTRAPTARGNGPAASATMTSPVHTANTPAASRGRSGATGPGPAGDSLVTPPTVTGPPTDRISLEDDGLFAPYAGRR